MKRSNILLNTVFYAIYMILSCVAVMFAEMLIIKIIDLFVGLSPFVLCIVRAVIYLVGVNALLAIVAYREGYRAAEFSINECIISGALASLLHFILALLFSFEAFCAGAVKFISALVLFGDKLNLKSFDGSLDRFDMIPFFFIMAAVYVTVMTISGRLGEKQRLLDREELTGGKTDAENTTEET